MTYYGQTAATVVTPVAGQNKLADYISLENIPFQYDAFKDTVMKVGQDYPASFAPTQGENLTTGRVGKGGTNSQGKRGVNIANAYHASEVTANRTTAGDDWTYLALFSSDGPATETFESVYHVDLTGQWPGGNMHTGFYVNSGGQVGFYQTYIETPSVTRRDTGVVLDSTFDVDGTKMYLVYAYADGFEARAFNAAGQVATHSSVNIHPFPQSSTNMYDGLGYVAMTLGSTLNGSSDTNDHFLHEAMFLDGSVTSLSSADIDNLAEYYREKWFGAIL